MGAALAFVRPGPCITEDHLGWVWPVSPSRPCVLSEGAEGAASGPSGQRAGALGGAAAAQPTASRDQGEPGRRRSLDGRGPRGARGGASVLLLGRVFEGPNVR